MSPNVATGGRQPRPGAEQVPAPALGPAELTLVVAAARRYYLDGRSKIDIAAELGVSRFKVARLLDAARSAGIVRIDIVQPGGIDAELSDVLRTRFGLRHAVVVATEEDDPGQLRVLVGRAAAELLTELTVPDDVVGIAWGRSLHEMTRTLSTLPRCTLVQLCGVLSRPDVEEGAVELVRQLAAVTGGRARTFYAPLVVPDPATAAVLRRQPGVAEALAEMNRLTKAVVAIGGWAEGISTLYEALDPDERQQLAGRGVQAESAGLLFDGNGRLLGALADRVVAVTEEQLRRTPDVLALAYGGGGKAAAVRSVLRSRLISGLVTHAALAHAVLCDAPD